MWRADVECQLVICCYAVLKYIAKYASKVGKRFESYHHFLTILSNSIGPEDHALCAYGKFIS